MSIQERRNSKGKVFFSYSYTDPITKRRVRLPKHDTPRFSSLEEAVQWGRARDLSISNVKQALTQRAAWKDTFKPWTELLEKFAEYKKKSAPQSHRRVAKKIEKYVLPFFLGVKNAENAETWHEFFAEYQLWLGAQIHEKADRKLALNTQNQCILSLNALLTYLVESKVIHLHADKRCEFNKEHLGAKITNNKELTSAEAVRQIQTHGLERNEESSDFYELLSATGMRLSEHLTLRFGKEFS